MTRRRHDRGEREWAFPRTDVMSATVQRPFPHQGRHSNRCCFFFRFKYYLLWAVVCVCPCGGVPGPSGIPNLLQSRDRDGNILVTSETCSSSARTDALVSMSTIVFNEAPYLDEWISYHWAIGVGHFYLYDHGSTDAPQGSVVALLEPYIRRGLVTLHNWSTYVTYNPGPQNRKREPGSPPRKCSSANEF